MNRILVKEELAPKIKMFEVENPGVAGKVKPGQFVILRVDERGERFPLTIAGADPSKGTITIVFNEVGKSTKQLGRFDEGEEILDLAGPLGNPSEIENFGTVLCFGGGVMIGPILYEVLALREAGNRIITVIGARIKELLIFKEELKNLSHEFCICTDDGSEGYKGIDFLEEILKKEKVDRVIAMSTAVATMQAICDITKPYNIKTIVSLSPIMLDGTGMCGTCRVSVGGETKFTCVDGPEFDGHLVDWDLLESRKRMYSPEERISSLSYERLEERFILRR